MMDKKHVAGLLDKLILLDQQTQRAYYDMGQILYAFKESKLYTVLGYNSFTEMVKEELTFSTSVAHAYSTMFYHFQRLHYSTAEAVKLLNEHSYTNLRVVLPDLKIKVGTKAIKTRIDSLDSHQINFTLNTKELTEAHQALQILGATRSEDGRYNNSSEAFMGMVHDVLSKTKRAA